MQRSPCRVIFDLTTSAQWYGPQGGIVQTERGLGRFAPEASEHPVVFSVYDLARKRFCRLRPQIAADVIEGKVRIRFPYTRQDRQERASAFERTRWVVSHPARFARHKLSRVRRRPTSVLTVDGSPNGAARAMVPLADAVERDLTLTESDIIVSCGSDWHGKDVYAILEEKQRHCFSYVSVCYDVIPWKHPGFWPRGIAAAVTAYHAEATWLSDLVMCISKTTAREYTAFCSDLDLACPELRVFRLGDTRSATEELGRLPAELEESPFVLMVGSLEPRKNHRLMYEVWDDLVRDESFPNELKLVFAGSQQWMTDDLMLEIELNTWVKDRIVVLRQPDDPVLRALYSRCLFTVLPSLDEGWGLPVAESLSHGKICLVSDRGSLPEVSDLSISIDVHDFYRWRDIVKMYATNHKARETLERRIAHSFAPRSWRESAREFFGTIERALGES